MQIYNSLHNHSARLLQACVCQFRDVIECVMENGLVSQAACACVWSRVCPLSPPLQGESNGLLIKEQVR